MAAVGVVSERFIPCLSSLLIVEAAAGPARRRWLEKRLPDMPGRQERTFSVSADFDGGGPWAGVNELFSMLYPEIQAQRPDLIERHTFELVHVLPQLRRVLVVRNPSLTDLAPPGERSRNYAADRAFRIAHGLIDLLDRWKSYIAPEAKWFISCDAYDAGGPMSRSFFKELWRRRGERLHLNLLLAVTTGKGKVVQSSFSGLPGQLATINLSDRSQSEIDPATAAAMAVELEERIGNDALQKQAHLPDLIRLWGIACRPDKVLHYKYSGLEICNPLGLYEDALRYADNILTLAAEHAPDDHFLRWSIIMKMLACYSSLQNAKAGLELAEGEGLRAVKNHPSWRGQLFYLIAMLYARYSQPRDLAKGEEYLERGLAAIAEANLPEDEFHLHSVFNRNGLAMIRSFQGRHQEAIELCRDGIVRLNKHLAADKHRLHRSVLVYNITQVYSAIGSDDQALKYYAALMQMDPNYSEYHNERGNIFLRLGRLEEAHADYLKAIKLSPPYFEVFTNLGQCCRRMGALDEAAEAYSRALDLEPNQLLALVGRAKAYEELGQTKLATVDYTAVVDRDSSQWEAIASRGVLHYEAGNLPDSLADFNRALQLKPNESDLYQNRATVLADLGRHREAAADLKSALRLNPREAERADLQSRLENELRMA